LFVKSNINTYFTARTAIITLLCIAVTITNILATSWPYSRFRRTALFVEIWITTLWTERAFTARFQIIITTNTNFFPINSST
tara:strand:+ start:165 stop:410 length:246 start_codon:yes stop_codon:yes gene_type:complete